MPARLVPLTPGQAPPIPLERPVVLIGRHPECDVQIDRPQISRRHCCVAQTSARLVIRDLGSRHGVWVNGSRVGEAPLALGDEVAIAQILYRLDPIGPPPKPKPAAPPPPPSSLSDSDESDLVPLGD